MKHAIAKQSHPTTYADAYTVVLERPEDDDGIWTAEVPAFGIVTEGRGRGAARLAARKAIIGYIEVAQSLGREVPGGDLLEARAVVAPRMHATGTIASTSRKAATARKKSPARKAQRRKTSPGKQLAKKTTRR